LLFDFSVKKIFIVNLLLRRSFVETLIALPSISERKGHLDRQLAVAAPSSVLNEDVVFEVLWGEVVVVRLKRVKQT
jgi:hypothetical protein